MSDLPEGWIVTSLASVGRWSSGGTPPRKNPEYFGKGFPWVKSGDLPDGPVLSTQEQITEAGLLNSSAKLLPKGTISLALYGATIGKLGVLTFQAATNQACANVVPDPSLVDADYLFLFLLSQRRNLIEQGQGGAQPNISQEIVKAHPIFIAPLDEQRRIVARLEELLEKVGACQKRLGKIPVLFKRFRQSVLAAACSGRLTADWRAEQNVAEDLENTTVEAIAEYVGGFAYKSTTFTETGHHQVIRIGNVRPLALNLAASPVFIPENIVAETQRFRLQPNDLVISMTGTKYKRDYGNAAIVKESDGSLYLNQRVARLRCREKVLPQFLLYWLQTDVFREFFFAGETGNVNQGNVGANGIREAPIDLPSLAEQHEIVRRVEGLFALAEQIEARYDRAHAQVDKLTQSILAKAFRGELVPTEAELARREGRVRTRLNSSGSSTQGTCPAGQTKARRVARDVKQ